MRVCVCMCMLSVCLSVFPSANKFSHKLWLLEMPNVERRTMIILKNMVMHFSSAFHDISSCDHGL